MREIWEKPWEIKGTGKYSLDLYPATQTKENLKIILEVKEFVWLMFEFFAVIIIFYVDEQGDSKCVAFALCLDNESVKKALNLDG